VAETDIVAGDQQPGADPDHAGNQRRDDHLHQQPRFRRDLAGLRKFLLLAPSLQQRTIEILRQADRLRVRCSMICGLM